MPPAFGSHLVLGGARSGKTAYALALADASGREKWMLATAGVEDEEMAERIALHRAERAGDWQTLEEQYDLTGALVATARPSRIIVVDCLTLWLSNLSFKEFDLAASMRELTAVLPSLHGPVIFVSNELGMGLAPETTLGRRFRDAQGRLNQLMAVTCQAVTFVAAGLPLVLKG